MPADTYHRCRHFTGLQHRRCALGIEYTSVRDGSSGPYRWPCLQLVGRPVCLTECEARSLLTYDELRREEEEMAAALERACSDIASGKCHVCGAAAEPSRVIGRCKYAACGHRIGQVAAGVDDAAR